MKRLLITLIALTVSALSLAQFDMGENYKPTPAWEQFKLPAKTMKLDFRNASVDAIISLFSKTAGITIVKDPNLKEPMTITSAKAVTLKEAFQIFDTALSLRNFNLVKEGNLLVIRPKPAQPQGGRFGGFDPSRIAEMMGQGGENQSELKYYPIQFANASQIARVINEVFLQQQQGAGFQLPGGGMIQFGGGGGGGGRQNQMANMMGGRRNQAGQTVRASSDDYSNTVIVNAPRREQGQVEELIKQIDKRTEDPLQPKVYKLQYAGAAEIAPVVQNVLTANAPKGRGGIGTQNIPFEQRFQQAARLGSMQASFGTVVADTRTNSLVVSATAENHTIVEQVVKDLDTEVRVESTTFVFPLDNARADQVANLLTQAFGTRQGMGGNRGNFGNNNFGRNNGNQNRNNQNRNNNNNNVRFGGLGGNNAPAGDAQAKLQDQLELELQDPGAEAGELMTNIGVSQGFFGGGGQQNRPQTGGTTGRDAQGRLVNVQDLTNQITVIPDPNTNSIIVVGSPDAADVIRGILGQLDKIPEQVMIETIIVEATLDETTRLGVEWTFLQEKAFGTPGATGTASQVLGGVQNASGLRYTLTSGNLNAFLNAFQSDDKFQVLSTPRIFTSNNVQAEINISQRVPFVVSQREDANGNLTFNYDFEDVGIVLTVTPRITANGYVTMDVTQTANDLQGFTDFNAPIVNQRQANTTVAVKDGDTIILGGIIRSTVNTTVRKIPLLGDIPILGNLFKTTSKEKSKTELMVFLTPRVVRNPEEATKLREEQAKQLSKQTQGELNKAMPVKKEGDGLPQNPNPAKNGGGKK